MNEENKLKKYFIKDEELFSIEEDKLNSKDVAKNISMIIENVEPSYAIAVTGKSGIGKSSVINILTEEYAKNSDKYNVQKINVWKQEKNLKEILDESYAEFDKHEEDYLKYSKIVNENVANNDGNNVQNDVQENVQENIQNEAKKEIQNDENQREKLLDKYYNQNIEEDDNTESSEEKYVPQEVKTFNKTIKRMVKFIFTVFISWILTTLIFIGMEYIGNRAIYKRNDVFFVENTYLNYKENFLLIAIFTLGLTAMFYIIGTIISSSKKPVVKTSYNNYQKNNKKKSKIKYDSSKRNLDEKKVVTVYENAAKNSQVDNSSKDTTGFSRAKEMIKLEKIKNAEKANKEELERVEHERLIDISRKNIIIIEDVDKLTASKMLKTLEDVKYCGNYKNCILVVPFDEKVLEKAIEFRNQVKINANYRPLKFEKIFEKVFQFKIYVPNISNGNIKDFAVNLAKDYISDFMVDYTDSKTFEKVIRNVLIHKGVKTPRHVKKLMNNYINNKILIMNRVESGKIDETVVADSKFDLELAKISVIQSDFVEFYNLLFNDFDYLEVLTSLCCMDINELREVYDKINEDLKPFFANKYIPLRRFLVQTKLYDVTNMSILMYMTKIKIDKLFKDKSVYNYVIGDEDITELRIQEVLELIKTLDSKQDVKEFTENNFAKLLNKYEENSTNIVYFTGLKDVVSNVDEYISKEDYIRFLELVVENYNYYPEQAFETLENTQYEIPQNIMNALIVNVQPSLSKDNFDDVFEFIKDNSDSLYEEGGNITEYVHFLINNIGLSSNPTAVIEELDSNFTRIGKVYELNKNIKGLENLDYDKTYEFLAKCVDNSDFDKMIEIMNSILSDENSVQDGLNIESKMNNYGLIDVVECNVDDILAGEDVENGVYITDDVDEDIIVNANAVEEEKISDDSIEDLKVDDDIIEDDFFIFDGNEEVSEAKEIDVFEDIDELDNGEVIVDDIIEDDVIAENNKNNDSIENNQKLVDNKSKMSEEEKMEIIEKAKLIENNYVLLKNMIEVCALKQKQIEPTDTLKLLEKATKNISNYEYLVSVFGILEKFDNMYFYELRRGLNDVLYTCFHASRSKTVKKAIIDISNYFKNTRLLKAKLTGAETKFFDENQ